MKKLIETIVSEVMNTLSKKEYSTNSPGTDFAPGQCQSTSGSTGFGQRRNCGGGKGGQGSGRGGAKGGGGCGGR